MALPKIQEPLNYISQLPDEPNDVGGLSAAQLKTEFDRAGQEIKEYINEELIPQIESDINAAAVGVGSSGSIDGSKIGDKSISGSKLADGAITSKKYSASSIPTTAYQDDSVTRDKLAPYCIGETEVGSGEIKRWHLADEIIDDTKLLHSSVTTPKVADKAITEPKVADGAITTPKVADGSITRVKLAQDSLYSPVVNALPRGALSGNSWLEPVLVEDIGKTYWINPNSVLTSAQALIYEIEDTDDVFPFGAEIYFFKNRESNYVVQVNIHAAKSIISGEYFNPAKSFRIVDKYAGVCVKKVESGLWVVFGDYVEVVA